ncbi:phosphatidylglycerol phospholipase C [Aspergillus udagawae]|uniref:Phosphatidylglycerol phospholipase C n=1 Tax=Aspergillus udagawae TaxID=91492 RepID=A0A8H3RPF9_9EURO|nr:phosphatidylglycerol phospholipase C [Aspergillus udagawae]
MNPASKPKPQTIAHRGKTKHLTAANPRSSHYPENTLESFRAAAAAGCDAIETDLRVSSDGVIVICHDRSLERVYGVKRFVDECTWEELQTLKTAQAPHVRMPRLVDFLQLLCEPGWERMWVVLDIKLGNLPERIIPLLAEAFESVASATPWSARVVLGCWSAAFFPLCESYLPGFETALICFDLWYASRVLRGSPASANVNQKVLMGMGRGFLEEARAAGRRVFVWTVNEPSLMRWSIERGVDGVITDDPGRCRAMVLDAVKGASPSGMRHDERVTVSQRAQAWAVSLLVVMFGWLFRRKFLYKLEKRDKGE